MFLRSSGAESSIIRVTSSFKWMRFVKTPLFLISFAKKTFLRAERKEKGDKKAKLFHNITLKALKNQCLLIPLACIRIILILMN